MDEDRPITPLWRNLCAALRLPPTSGVDAVHRKLTQTDPTVSRGNVQRIKEGARSYIDTVERVAAAAGLQTWELLVPMFDPDQKPSEILGTTPPKIPLSKEVIDALRRCEDEKVLKNSEAYLRIHLGLSQQPISGNIATGSSTNANVIPHKPNGETPDVTRK